MQKKNATDSWKSELVLQNPNSRWFKFSWCIIPSAGYAANGYDGSENETIARPLMELADGIRSTTQSNRHSLRLTLPGVHIPSRPVLTPCVV
jgi:hypothetical protein